MDTINHPLKSMQAVRQYEEEHRRRRSAANHSSSTSSSPSHLPRSRTSSIPSLAETECSEISSSSSTLPSDKKTSELPYEHRRSPSEHSRGAGSISTQSSFHTAQQEHLLNDEADESSQMSAPLERISSSDRRWLEDFIDNDDESQLTFTTHATTKTGNKHYEDENEENLPQAAATSPQRSILSAGSTLAGLDVLSTAPSILTTTSSNVNGILNGILPPPPPPPPPPGTPTPQESNTLESDFLIPQRRVVSPKPRSDQNMFGMGEDPINRFLRTRQKRETTDTNIHYISDTDDDSDDDDAEDNPAIIANYQNRQKNQTHSIISSQLSSEEQEVARMTAQLSTQCDLYQKKISTPLADAISVASGTSASIRATNTSSAVPRRGPTLQTPPTITNSVRIHVYDLLPKDAEIELFPWGCHVPIGQCLVTMNDGLHALGSGAYHVGVEVNGVEFAYGANDVPSLSGVFTCHPRTSPGYQYRTTIDFGDRISSTPRVDHTTTMYDGHKIMQGMAREYMGCDYDLLRRNCCTFARDACLRLGVTEHEIPPWFLHLSSAGADAHDVVNNVEAAVDRSVEPLKRMLSVENSSSHGRRRSDRPKSVLKGKDENSTANVSCGKTKNGSAIDSVVNAIGRSLCFNPQLLTNSCAT